MSNDDREQKLKLIELIRDATKHDEELRKKYDIGDRFKFVRDRLHALLDQLEKHAKATEPAKPKEAGGGLSEGEAIIFIYLYNAQGILVSSWQKMLTPKLLYEYGINRPLYANYAEIDLLIRNKANKVQHGYLAVIVKKDLIVPTGAKDAFDSPIIRVKEGALSFDRIVSFTHNDINYSLDAEGNLVKKTGT
jgi:hypothetical protein